MRVRTTNSPNPELKQPMCLCSWRSRQWSRWTSWTAQQRKSTRPSSSSSRAKAARERCMTTATTQAWVRWSPRLFCWPLVWYWYPVRCSLWAECASQPATVEETFHRMIQWQGGLKLGGTICGFRNFSTLRLALWFVRTPVLVAFRIIIKYFCFCAYFSTRVSSWLTSILYSYQHFLIWNWKFE